MLFKPELCQAILDGRKGQTRRLVKPYETARILTRIGREIRGVWVAQYDRPPPEIFGSTQILEQLYRRKWIVGRTYAIQPGRGKKAVGRFLLTGIRREWLQDITGQDAIAEGFQPIQCSAGIVLIPDPKVANDIAIRMFARYWDSLYRPKYRWHKNPEVWVQEFENIT